MKLNILKPSRNLKLTSFLFSLLMTAALMPQVVQADPYSLEWESELSLSVWSTPLSTSDNQLLVGTDKGTVILLSPEGNEVWRFEGRGRLLSSPIELSDGRFVLGSQSGILYSLEKDGTLLWEYDLGAAIEATAVESSEDLIFTGTKNGKINAVSAEGELVFSFEIGATFNGNMKRSQNGDMFANTNDGRLIAFNNAGIVLWEYQSDSRLSSPVFDSNNNVYFTSLGGDVISLTSTGQHRWKQTINSTIWAAPTFNANNALITVGTDGRVIAWDLTGEKLWGYRIGEVTDSTPIGAANGTAFFATRSSRIIALDESGTLVWSAELDAPVHASMSLNGLGNLVAVSTNGAIVSLQTYTFPLKTVELPTEPVGFVALQETHYSTEEGKTVDITLLRKEGTSGILEARVYTRDISTVSGVDYSAIDQIVRFEDGELSKVITLTTLSDAATEEEESLEIRVESQGTPTVQNVAVVVLSNVEDSEEEVSPTPTTPAPPVTGSQQPENQPSAPSKSGGAFCIMLPLLIGLIAVRKRKFSR